MKFMALRFRVDGVEHALVDTVNPGNVEERHRFMRQAFPENGAELVMVEIPDHCATAETLRPEADPFSHEAIAADVREAYRAAKQEAEEIGAILDAESARRARAQLPTLDDSLLDRDRRANAGLGRK